MPSQEDTEATSQVPFDAPFLVDAFEQLRGSVEKMYAVVDRQAGLIDKLHEENERLRRGEFDRMLDPIVRDLIALSDTCLRTAQAWLARSSTTPADTAQVLDNVAGDLTLILERQGIEVYEPAAGTPFDRKQQRSVRTETTSDEANGGMVAATLRPGYRNGARTLRFADVVVWKHVPAEASSEQWA
ncbi:nucleotide exchange factor GrpE [Frankia sp. Cas3]|uniref:nucleotide exchange factor GrpE n=1 Tax=Frankia sp. Cas3 TaxID=3073926 RepID=UPI002AD4D7CD|nr:nucleotide exchange factor GrpE [Frankia sp. Cas3]